MDERVTLAFGPLAYEVPRRHMPPRMLAFVTPDVPDARRVECSDAPPPPDAVATLRAALLRAPTHDTLFVRPPHTLPVTDGLCTLVALDAPALDCVLLHAAAVHTARGLALLVGPPGVGKSTLARAASPPAFAFNSVLVRRDGACWALPFAGDDDDPPVAPGAPQRAALVIDLFRAERALCECLPGAGATVALMRACVRPIGIDPAGAARARCVFFLAGSLSAARLGLSANRGVPYALDSALQRIFSDVADR